MRLNDIINESFSDARIKFSRDASADDIIKYLDRFKELSKKDLIKGSDKDIGKWIKSGWDDFKEFVDQYDGASSKSSSKKAAKKDSILVHEDNKIRVVIPLSKESSCFYGRNTQWCTSSTESENHWDRYFYSDADTLFYILPKDDSPKMAILLKQRDPEYLVTFDDTDHTVDFDIAHERFGITRDMIGKWFSENQDKIESARNINNLDQHIQARLLVQFPQLVQELKDKDDDLLQAVASKNVFILDYLDDPSEAVQLAAVNKNIRSLRKIKNPPESVQLRAIERNPLAYTLIKNPTEKATELYHQMNESSPLRESANKITFKKTTGDASVDRKIKDVEYMTPDEYLKNAYEATDGRMGGSFEGWMASNEVGQDQRRDYAQAMKNGESFPLPWINYEDGSQDGRNRALAAKSIGVKKIPVGIVPKKSTNEKIPELEKELETAKGYRKFKIEQELERLKTEA